MSWPWRGGARREIITVPDPKCTSFHYASPFAGWGLARWRAKCWRARLAFIVFVLFRRLWLVVLAPPAAGWPVFGSTFVRGLPAALLWPAFGLHFWLARVGSPLARIWLACESLPKSLPNSLVESIAKSFPESLPKSLAVLSQVTGGSNHLHLHPYLRFGSY